MSPTTVPPEVSHLVSRAADAVRELLGPATRVLWYGSWVSGTAVPRSDVDLAVAADRQIPPVLMARLREQIDALPTLRKIDLVDVHQVGDALRERILSEGLVL